MKKLVIVISSLAALALPGAAQASPEPGEFKNAAKFCKALRADMGAELFRQAFADHPVDVSSEGESGEGEQKGGNGIGRCVSLHAKTIKVERRQARRQCRPERESAAASRRGHGKKAKKALRRCVARKLRAEVEDEHDDLVNAAKRCKAERAGDAEAFAAKYRNFGKCVSTKARDHEAGENETEGDEGEQDGRPEDKDGLPEII